MGREELKDKSIRSYNMSRIRNKDTKPEILVRKYLFAEGFRYRKNDKKYPGCPDIVLPKYKTAIFINGCFWHMHEGCKYFVWPKSNENFWKTKLNSNVDRDRTNYLRLADLGWNVIVIWECELKKEKRDQTLLKLKKRIIDNSNCTTN